MHTAAAMDTIVVCAALASALLHAGWNAAVKASPWAARVMTTQMQAAAVMVLPILAWDGLPAPAAWRWARTRARPSTAARWPGRCRLRLAPPATWCATGRA